MQKPDHKIFRESALKHYMQSNDKATLPHFINLPTALLLWLLLVLIICGGMLAWSEEVPQYTTVQGIVAGPRMLKQSGKDALGLMFVQPDESRVLRPGFTLQVNVGPQGLAVPGTVIRVVPRVMSPLFACQMYQLDDTCAQLVTQPSVLVVIRLHGLPSSLFAGTLLTATIKIGSLRITALIPGVSELVGK